MSPTTTLSSSTHQQSDVEASSKKRERLDSFSSTSSSESGWTSDMRSPSPHISQTSTPPPTRAIRKTYAEYVAEGRERQLFPWLRRNPDGTMMRHSITRSRRAAPTGPRPDLLPRRPTSHPQRSTKDPYSTKPIDLAATPTHLPREYHAEVRRQHRRARRFRRTQRRNLLNHFLRREQVWDVDEMRETIEHAAGAPDDASDYEDQEVVRRKRRLWRSPFGEVVAPATT